MKATTTEYTKNYINWCLEQVVGSEWHNVEIILQAYRFINHIGEHQAWGLLQDKFETSLWNTGNFIFTDPRNIRQWTILSMPDNSMRAPLNYL